MILGDTCVKMFGRLHGDLRRCVVLGEVHEVDTYAMLTSVHIVRAHIPPIGVVIWGVLVDRCVGRT